ncbi:hypothetical protein BJY00DRAFT_316704 [Aspergillus carlsbadensis]|nr:hypothetical protein BJY00DRAFT_316704 [Aspergillus carlsbadensis]
MAEPIGLASGVLALAEAGFKLPKTIHEVGSSIVNARSELTELAGELDNFASVLVSVGEAVQKADTEGRLSSSDNLVKVTEQVLDKCGLEFEKIRKMVKFPTSVLGSSGSGSRSIATWDRIRWSMRKSQTTSLKASLECSKSSLMLMLQTLHLAVGLHALRSVDKISRGAENPSSKLESGKQRKLLTAPGAPLSRSFSQERSGPMSVDERNKHIASAQLIVMNTVTAVCGASGEPVLDTKTFDILMDEIDKMVAEYSASAEAFQMRVADDRLSDVLSSLKNRRPSQTGQASPELDESNDIALRDEMKELESDLEVLQTVFLAQKQLINEMIAACNDLCHDEQLATAIGTLKWINSVVDSRCTTRVTDMLRSCRAVILGVGAPSIAFKWDVHLN